MMNTTENKMSNTAKRANFLKQAVDLELQLAEAMGHTEAAFVGNIEDGVIYVNNREVPKYVRDPGATFLLMCEYNVTPDRSSQRIAYEDGWAYVLGTKARVDLRDYDTLAEAYAVVIAQAVIEKISG